MTTAKLLGVGLYLLVLLAIGIVASRRMKDLRDYFAGGKRLGFLSVAFSARATGESAWLLLGLTGMGAAVGVKGFWVVAGETLGVAGAWLLMSRRFHRLTRRYDAITIPDYLEARLRDDGHRLRAIAAITLVAFVTVYVSAQIDATGKAFESFLGWNYFVGALVGFVVVIIYTVSGGFVAVVWSDVFQGSLMVIGLVLLPVMGLIALGGPSEMTTRLAALDPGLLSPFGPGEGATVTAVLSILGLLLLGAGFLGSPQIFVRFLALKDEGEISRGALVAIVWTLLADGGAVLVGMTGRALLTSPGVGVAEAMGAAEGVLPALVEHVMPAFLVGIYIAIVLSAIMSTVDSLLVLASSAMVRDGYQRILHPDLPDDRLVRLSRVTTFAIAGVALVIALVVAVSTPERTVFWFVIFGWSGIAATFCPTMILSLFWRRLTAKGAMAAMVTGFLCVPVFRFGVAELGAFGAAVGELSELPPAFALGALVAVGVSLRDKAGQARLAGVDEELADSARRSVPRGERASS